jgi:Domain of unknown function (DUF3482)/50S ribosome-binding GTPase
MSAPVFVVVGHPNKGKSSIVATLAQDDSVEIAPDPGTTTHSRRFPMRVDGRVLYTLVDTPGFQRPRDVLRWLKQHETSVVEHPTIVQRFVEQHAGTSQYAAECGLLRPIIDGGGILYVVDGSVPFGSEYEPEMEILRWTGRPSMALINPIGQERYIEQWEAALGQYFKIVRVFNALTAEFEKRLELLRAFGQLREDWRQPMEEAISDLVNERTRQRRRAAEAIARMLIEMMTLTVGKTIPPQADAKAYYGTLEEEYKQKLRHIERTSRDTVQSVYQHYQVQREDADAAALVSSVVEGDLFATETWRLFGQTRWRLAMLGAASGATVGGIVDASVGGASVLLGTVIGATVGGALGWHAAEWSSNFRLLTLPGIDALALGGKYLQCGPTTNRNLPYVALGRARWHHRLIALRTHAQRNVIRLDTVPQQAGGMPPLEESEERALEHLFAEIRKAAGSERVWDMVEEVRAVVQRLLERDEQS